LGVVKIGNGDVFEGQFENNLKNGIGVYHYKGERGVCWSVLSQGSLSLILFYMNTFYISLSLCRRRMRPKPVPR
jgi:hypothetical protein